MSYEFLSIYVNYQAPKIYQQLLKCHELATEFVQELADLKNTPLPESLASYTKDRKLQQKSAEEILELMEARLNKFRFFKIEWSKTIKLRRTGAKMISAFYFGLLANTCRRTTFYLINRWYKYGYSD